MIRTKKCVYVYVYVCTSYVMCPYKQPDDADRDDEPKREIFRSL